MMTSKAGRRMCFICALLFTVLIEAQETSLTPVASALPQFDGTFRASGTSGVEEAYLTRLFRSSHAANLLELQNRDLLCFWFSGTREGESNVAIVMSRLAKGSEQWSRTVEIDHQEGRSFQNPVAFQSSGGRVWLLHTSQPAGQGQMNAEVLYLTSDDAGQTWTTPQSLFTQAGSFIRHPPVLISKKVWLLPMYYTPSRSITNGAEADHSAIKITSDGGKSWKECNVPQSNGLVQPTVVRLANKHFLAFFRSRYADFIYQSTSASGCDWTAPTPTHLPNNNSSIQLAKLRDGSLVIAFNNSSAGVTREKARTSVRKPLSIALSDDGGQTWPWVRDIDAGSSGGHPNDIQEHRWTPEEYSYPSLLQDANGKIVVAYTYSREAIKVVRFAKEWIKQGHTEGKFKGDGPS
jgi:predicted neuraminidase